MAKKKPEPKEPTPEQKMIDMTRRLLNVKKSEVDDLRRKQKPRKRS